MFHFFKENSERYRREAVNLAKIEALYFPSMSLFIGLSTLLTIMIGGLAYIRGSETIGLDTIVEFVIYINMLTFPVSAIGWTASMIQRAAASQKRLNEFLTIKPTIDNNKAKQVKLTGEIEFRNVNFIYSNTGIKALDNFDLHIKAGEKIAIVGKTGSGKTSIVQLLLRLYDCTSGVILLDNKEISSIALDNLRSQISYVPQDGFLFSDNIINNIGFGLNNIDNEAIEKAAQMAAVHQDITGFPSGYQTIVGERGVTLSGGQKQRISIARALIKNAPILILDDSLSAVDTKTENEILSQINQYMKGRTAILVTHKIASLANFDRILVIDEGKIVEKGTHHELISLAGIYSEMYKRQRIDQP
jgi:ATP-binding cassette subfamily B protein